MNLKGYVSVRDPVPVSVQNMVVREYCARNSHNYNLSDVEFVTPGYPMLEGILEYLDAFDGIVAYSMFQVPAAFAPKVAARGKEIHFALENYSYPKDRETCETIWALTAI